MTSPLKRAFQRAVEVFNDANTVGTYNGLGPYLNPNVVVYRVDDPTAPPQTTSGAVIADLNATQIGVWPTLTDYAITETSTTIVTGTATYKDSQSAAGYPVTFFFEFDANYLVLKAIARPVN